MSVLDKVEINRDKLYEVLSGIVLMMKNKDESIAVEFQQVADGVVDTIMKADGIIKVKEG